MHENQSSYSRWTWIGAIILALILLLLALTGHGPMSGCCTGNTDIKAVDNTAPSAVVTPIPNSFSFKVSAAEFSNEGDGLTVPWFSKADQLKTMLADGDDWTIYGDDKNVTLAGTAKSEAIKQQKSEEVQHFFGAEVKVNNEMTVMTNPVVATVTPPALAKLYFALGEDRLPANSTTTLEPIIAWLKAHSNTRAIISGYHDTSGNYEKNQELAKARAQATYDAIAAAGIDTSRIVMKKPQETTGTGDLAEARRVEVSIE